MRNPSIVCCVLSLTMLTACAQAPAPAPATPEADASALKETEIAAFIKDWNGKDVERILSHYADDANAMIQNSQIITGKDALRKVLKEIVADPAESLALTSVQVEVSKGGDLGYTRGNYVFTSTDPASKKVLMDKGKFITIFRKQADGKWKVIQDISNADAPPVPAAR